MLASMSELKQRILFVLGALIVYRVGTYIPVPGVDSNAIAELFSQTRGSIVDVFNMFSGGALSRLSIFALGVMPYISASIIMQMMSAIVPSLEQLKKEGEAGRRKITQYNPIRHRAPGHCSRLSESPWLSRTCRLPGRPVILIPGIGFKIITAASLVAGTMFLVWLGRAGDGAGHRQRDLPDHLRLHRRRVCPPR